MKPCNKPLLYHNKLKTQNLCCNVDCYLHLQKFKLNSLLMPNYDKMHVALCKRHISNYIFFLC